MSFATSWRPHYENFLLFQPKSGVEFFSEGFDVFVSGVLKFFLPGFVLFDTGLKSKFRNPRELESLYFDSLFDLNSCLFLFQFYEIHGGLHSQIQSQHIDIFNIRVYREMDYFSGANLF